MWGRIRTVAQDSISDSSEKVFQIGSRKVTLHVILVKGEYMQSSTYFSKRFLLA